MPLSRSRRSSSGSQPNGTILSPESLTSTVDWSRLDPWQETISREEFGRLLQTIYAPAGALDPFLQIDDQGCRVFNDPGQEREIFRLRFRPSGRAASPAAPRLGPLRVVLDPGHIGGQWAEMEERCFVHEGGRPVKEGDLTLAVARHLAVRLREQGLDVRLTRHDATPVTDKRPADFLSGASGREAEQQFYRQSEIGARADLINHHLRPQLTLCLHFNAAPWDARRCLVEDNRLLFFVHGNYLATELQSEPQRWRLVDKLLARVDQVELPLARAIADAFVERTGLPAVAYPPGDIACRVDGHPYVYARNLAANRLYDGPVVYLEPYYMNSRSTYARIQAGDYEGQRWIEGRWQPSLWREYADAVADGMKAWLSEHR